MNPDSTTLGIRARALAVRCGAPGDRGSTTATSRSAPQRRRRRRPAEQRPHGCSPNAFATTVWADLNARTAVRTLPSGRCSARARGLNVTRYRAVWDNGKVNLTTPANSHRAASLAG
jgi:hypothetical protein